MQPPEQEMEEPAQLRFLRRLVTVLTAVMIGGVVLIIALLVIRLNSTPNLLPETITLPDGARAAAFTQGDDWYAVVTDQNEILIFYRLRGNMRQRIQIETSD